MSKFVTIQSQINVRVARGLDVIDNTNYSSDIPNRANFRPNWTKSTVIIKVGQHAYPAEIAEWPAVKALQKDRVITISTDTSFLSKEELAKAEEIDTALQNGKAFEDFNKQQNEEAKKKIEEKTKQQKSKELKDIDLEALAKEGE